MYKIYANSKLGYKNIDKVPKLKTVFEILDPLVITEQYDNYLIIHEKNNTDNIFAMFYTEQEYKEIKREYTNQKKLTKH